MPSLSLDLSSVPSAQLAGIRTYSLEQVAQLLHISYKTALTQRVRAPQCLPKMMKIGKSLLVLEEDLKSFFESHAARATAASIPRPHARSGRPTWREQEAAKAAGLTIKQYRESKASK